MYSELHMTSNAIAKELGYSPLYVRELLSVYSIYKYPKLNHNVCRKIVTSYVDGLSASAICNKYAISSRTLYRILRRYKVKRRRSKYK